MKKILSIIAIINILFVNSTLAYSLTSNDKKLAENISTKIESIIKKKWEKYRDKYIGQLNKIWNKYKTNERLKAIIDLIILNIEKDLSIEQLLLQWIDEHEKEFNISDFTSWVFNLSCSNTNNWSQSSWTAFLMKVSWKNTIFTNKHIFEWMNKCFFWIYTNLSNKVWSWLWIYFDPTEYYIYNSFSDFWIFYIPDTVLTTDEFINNKWKIKNFISPWLYWEKKSKKEVKNLTNELNYNISSIKSCPTSLKTWTKVYVIWYPKFWVTETETEIKWYWKVISTNREQILTDWIISWTHNQTSSHNASKNIYPYKNYFVSNKMDSWNSWWPAIAEYNNNLCLLWIATWVNTWNFDNQWMIQNIHNIYYID